jgi:E3 ubiquitin-protein ligase MYCBP2
MAVHCFCLNFRPSDHQFLHESHVFSNISRILSKSEEESEESADSAQVGVIHSFVFFIKLQNLDQVEKL